MNLAFDGSSVFAIVFPVLFVVTFGALSWALSTWSGKRMVELNARIPSSRRRQ